MTPGDLARVADIRARADAATGGPWRAVHADDGTFYGQPPTYDLFDGRDEAVACGGYVEEGGPAIGACETADAEFIAAARADVPWLLDRLAAETERADVAEAALSKANDREAEIPCGVCSVVKADHGYEPHSWEPAF